MDWPHIFVVPLLIVFQPVTTSDITACRVGRWMGECNKCSSYHGWQRFITASVDLPNLPSTLPLTSKLPICWSQQIWAMNQRHPWLNPSNLWIFATFKNHVSQTQNWVDELPSSRVVFYLADGYLTYATSDINWQKLDKFSESIYRFRETPTQVNWWTYSNFSPSIINSEAVGHQFWSKIWHLEGKKRILDMLELLSKEVRRPYILSASSPNRAIISAYSNLIRESPNGRSVPENSDDESVVLNIYPWKSQIKVGK